jgi:hypothetical protein
MKSSTVLFGAFEIGLMTFASIVGSFVFLVVDRNGSFAFSELQKFLIACGWIYALGALLMHGGNLIAFKTAYPIRFLLFVVFGSIISWLCHILFSIISWYWSIWLVLLVAAILISCYLIASGFRRKDS